MIHNAFSLIELLVVVAIVGILSALALPSYQSYVDDARRSQAQAALMAFAAAMERYYVETGSYSNLTAAGIFYKEVPQGATDKDRDYVLSIAASSDETYLLRAAANVNGTMSGDGDFTLNSRGARTWGSNDCWAKSC